MSSSPNQQTASTEDSVLRDSKRLMRTINRHLSENRCNHSLREIVKEGLE